MLACMCLPCLRTMHVCAPGLMIVCMCVPGLMSVCMCDAVHRGRSQTARQQTAASAAPSPPDSPTPQWGSPPTPSPLETLRLPTSLFQPPLQIPPPPRLVSTLHACFGIGRDHISAHTTGVHFILCPYVHTFLGGGRSGLMHEMVNEWINERMGKSP